MSEQIHLKFYLAGIMPEQQALIVEMKRYLRENYGDVYKIEVIDVFENPELAENDRILATPTVVRSLPGPIMKYILDMSSKERFLLGMDVVTK